jgi:hypothetical protein
MSSAQEKLDAAIAEFLNSEEWLRSARGDRAPGVLTDYVLITAESILDDKDGDRTSYGRVYKGGYQPYHITLGMLDVTQFEIKREMHQE